MMRIAAIVVLVQMFLAAAPVHAWGTKEHILLTRLAVLRLLDDRTTPAGLKDFLRANTPDLTDLEGARTFFLTAKLGAEPKDLSGLSFWVVEPDIRANKNKQTKIEPFGVPERLLHYVDLEFLHADVDKRAYRHDLSSRMILKDVPTDFTDPRYKEAGLLPFAVQRSFEKLSQSVKESRLVPDPARPKDEDFALRWMGYLAHYAQDNCQPQHATADYKSVSYFADRRKAPNVHSEVEWRMNDDEVNEFTELRKEYWESLAAALEQVKQDPYTGESTPWTETLMVADASYANLPLIGLAAMHAAGQAGTPEKPTGPAGAFDTEKFFRFESGGTTVLKMKAKQQALAVVRTVSLIRRAWDAAGK